MTAERIYTAILVFLGLGFLFIALPQQVESVGYGRIVPATVPTIALWVIIIAGIVQFFTSKECIELHLADSFRVIAFVAILVVAVWLIEKFGFEYFAPVFALSIMLFMGERRWYWLLFAAFVMPLGIWFLVENVLNRVLP
ncbi:tripartite tricarboxylate transporter TctB family protein [Litoreibacter arenae]|uniref:DUF1468 domain-containing protein n=1 Tax=Litoreibacter arenae DSM 19593 TaxID=1123360 RepID=S9QNP9_9RHOB|nr:tripartite tricarboxylate transporter TctB family protein [Litoreibacter arenae]EPX81243.1 hypothetical protein thalar_00693 [Litoreibacter arenae DSM 19593]